MQNKLKISNKSRKGLSTSPISLPMRIMSIKYSQKLKKKPERYWRKLRRQLNQDKFKFKIQDIYYQPHYHFPQSSWKRTDNFI